MYLFYCIINRAPNIRLYVDAVYLKTGMYTMKSTSMSNISEMMKTGEKKKKKQRTAHEVRTLDPRAG